MGNTFIRIGQKIRILRTKNGLSQDALAKILEVDKAYISRIENGKKNLTIKTLDKIANVLSVDIKKLF